MSPLFSSFLDSLHSLESLIVLLFSWFIFTAQTSRVFSGGILQPDGDPVRALSTINCSQVLSTQSTPDKDRLASWILGGRGIFLPVQSKTRSWKVCQAGVEHQKRFCFNCSDFVKAWPYKHSYRWWAGEHGNDACLTFGFCFRAISGLLPLKKNQKKQ